MAFFHNIEHPLRCLYGGYHGTLMGTLKDLFSMFTFSHYSRRVLSVNISSKRINHIYIVFVILLKLNLGNIPYCFACIDHLQNELHNDK
jgi:hypothetical protein